MIDRNLQPSLFDDDTMASTRKKAAAPARRGASAAERMATGGDEAAQAVLRGLGVEVTQEDMALLRRYDPATRRLQISSRAAPETRSFQLWLQVALLRQSKLLEATLDFARFQSDEARAIAKIGLANYFAGAAMMPYGAFLRAARESRHDLEILGRRFGASIEQVAHRLSTLQRPGAKGVPFFFVRVDQAGNVTKRHSATRLQFARYGAACPLWNVHQAFAAPGRMLRQLAQTPDGVRYICLATDVTKPGGAFGRPARRYAIGLGCEARHAARLVHADGLDLASPTAWRPIGISCRICERADCHQRAAPPLKAAIRVDHARREVLPYSLGAGPDSD